MYGIMSVIMFWVFGYSLALQYGEIQRQVETIVQPGPDMKDLLRSWSIRHSFTTCAVSKMNEYFSLVLLIEIGSTYAYMATRLSSVIIDDPRFDEMTFHCVKLFLLFYAICSAADFVRNSVMQL